MTALDKLESVTHPRLSDAVTQVPHLEEISARVSLALQQIQDPMLESLLEPTTLLVECVEQVLDMVRSQQSTIALLTARVEALERG